MENASFITTEDRVDLIVSFAILVGDYGDVKSLTLLRTPKYEFALHEDERGVDVSFDGFGDEENDMLERVVIDGDVVTITTRRGRSYSVSTAEVDDEEIEESRKILEKMNFDGRFELKFSVSNQQE